MLVPDSNMLVLIRSAVNNHLIVSLSEFLLFILAFDILLCRVYIFCNVTSKVKVKLYGLSKTEKSCFIYSYLP